MITQNSIDSYIDLIDTDELGEKQAIVLDYIRHHPDETYNTISRALGMHHNTLVARIKELRELGLVVKGNSVIDEYTGNKNATYHIRSPDEEPEQTPVRNPYSMSTAV